MTRQYIMAVAIVGLIGSGAALADDASAPQAGGAAGKSAFPPVYRPTPEATAPAPEVVASLPPPQAAQTDTATVGGMPIVDRPEPAAAATPAPAPAPVASAPASEAPAASAAPAPVATDDVVAEAERYLGERNMTGRRGPWCGAFANFILQKTGHAAMGGENVAAALHYGRHISEPTVGAMAIISTSYGREGHVGFVSRVNDDGSIQLVSGNWGNRVHDTRVPRRQVQAFVEVP